MLIQASRTRSAVGRTRESFGTARRRPPNSPATILMASAPGSAAVRGEGAEAGLQRGAAVPLIAFQAERHVDQPLAQPGNPVRPLESDGGQPRRPVLQH